MVKICKSCTDPTFCENVICCCEIAQEADIERLEDLRQSESFYESLNTGDKEE